MGSLVISLRGGLAAVLAISLAASASARCAESAHDETYDFTGRAVAIHDAPSEFLVLSKNCVRPNGRYRCLAYSAFPRARLVARKLQSADARVGLSDGARVCLDVGGVLAVGRRGNGDENLFCQFADDSFASVGALYARALARSRGVGASR